MQSSEAKAMRRNQVLSKLLFNLFLTKMPHGCLILMRMSTKIYNMLHHQHVVNNNWNNRPLLLPKTCIYELSEAAANLFIWARICKLLCIYKNAIPDVNSRQTQVIYFKCFHTRILCYAYNQIWIWPVFGKYFIDLKHALSLANENHITYWHAQNMLVLMICLRKEYICDTEIAL